jgi:hypothetical protein
LLTTHHSPVRSIRFRRFNVDADAVVVLAVELDAVVVVLVAVAVVVLAVLLRIRAIIRTSFHHHKEERVMHRHKAGRRRRTSTRVIRLRQRSTGSANTCSLWPMAAAAAAHPPLVPISSNKPAPSSPIRSSRHRPPHPPPLSMVALPRTTS